MTGNVCKQERTIPHHVKFSQFKHDEANVSRLAEKELDLLQLHPHQIFMEHANIEKVRRADQFGGLLHIGDEMDVGPFPLILTRLPIDRVVPKLVEVLFHLVLCLSAHLGVH